MPVSANGGRRRRGRAGYPARYSAAALLRRGLTHRPWPPAWRSHPLKSSYDVVIVGGGVHGLAAAYYLAANHGITDVAVLDKGYIGSGGSGRNTAILRSNYLTPEGVRFYDRSVRLYQRLATDLDYNVMFSQRGHLTLAHSDTSLRTMRWRAEVNKAEGVDSEVIGTEEIRRLVPFLDLTQEARYPVLGALYHPPGGIIRHDAVVWGYARGASARGVHIHQDTEVTGIDVADGRVRAVRTARGDIATRTVLNATAGWSTLIADMAGVRLPVTTYPLQAAVTEPVKPFLSTVIVSGTLHVYVSQTDRGELVFGASVDPFTSYSARGSLEFIEGLAGNVLELMPALSKVRLLRQWAGLCDMTPDFSPIMGMTTVAGFLVDVGWGTYGFKAGRCRERRWPSASPPAVRPGSSPPSAWKDSPPARSSAKRARPPWATNRKVGDDPSALSLVRAARRLRVQPSRPDAAPARPAHGDPGAVAWLPVPAGQRPGLGHRDLVPPDGLPEIHHGAAAYRYQPDAAGPRGERFAAPRAERPVSARPASMRLPPQPGEVIDRSQTVDFTWNGRPAQGYAGDTIVSALAAAGERTFSRSMKYHRRRGVLTASFHDPGCMVQVGDEPNVRGAHRLVSGGMAVTSQNTWPSLRFDVKAVNGFGAPFLTAGFYYKTFMRPRFLWPAYESVLRKFVNGGRVCPDTPPRRPAKRHVHPDVLIAGGGPAGMAAAVAAARAGARSCWPRRSISSAGTCAGARTRIRPPSPNWQARCLRSPASRC